MKLTRKSINKALAFYAMAKPFLKPDAQEVRQEQGEIDERLPEHARADIKVTAAAQAEGPEIQPAAAWIDSGRICN